MTSQRPGCVVVGHQGAVLDERADDLFQVEGVAGGFVQDVVQGFGRELGAGHQLGQQLAAVGFGQGLQGDLGVAMAVGAGRLVAQAPAALVVALAKDQAEHQRRLVGDGQQIVEQGQRGFVGPVQVVEGDDQRPLAGRGGEKLAGGPKGLLLADVGVEFLDPLGPGAREGQVHQVGQEGDGLAGGLFAQQLLAPLPEGKEGVVGVASRR